MRYNLLFVWFVFFLIRVKINVKKFKHLFCESRTKKCEILLKFNKFKVKIMHACFSSLLGGFLWENIHKRSSDLKVW